MKRSLILDTSIRWIYHPVLVLSLYLLFAGHNQPGGGFAGGLVAGAAIALRFLAGGMRQVRSVVTVRPWTVLGSGLLLAGVTAIVPMVFGQASLESTIFSVDVAVIGKLKTTTALFFDVGVYAVVVGLTLMMFEAFGDDSSPDPISREESR